MRYAHGKKSPMRNRKNKFIGWFTALLLAALTSSLLFVTGCQSPQGGQSIETKAQIIATVAAKKVLQKYPEATSKLVQARDDLRIIEDAPMITTEEILEIVRRLPPDTFSDPDTGLYIELGVLWFSDELGAVAAKNPEQLRSAARGLRRGLDRVIGAN